MVEKEAREPIEATNPEGSPTATSPEPVAPGAAPGTLGSREQAGAPSGTQPEHRGTVEDARRAFKYGTPNDVREEFRSLVSKGVAAVAGAMKGFSDTMRKEEVSKEAREAVKETGDTTREVGRTVSEEGKKVMDEGRKVAHDLGSKTRQTAKEVGGEAQKTAQEVGKKGKEVAEKGSQAAKQVQQGAQKGQSQGQPQGQSEPDVVIERDVDVDIERERS